MGNQFTCPHCRQSYRFLAAMAGQSMHCQGCGFVFRIPMVPVARAEGVDFSQAGRWLLRLASGRQFGPVRREMIREWLREGRADAESLVSPESGNRWYRVTDVFHKAFPDKESRPPATAGSPLPLPLGTPDDPLSPAAAIPAAGLLELLEDCAGEPPRGRLRSILRDHQQALASLETESGRAAGYLRPRGSKLIWLEEEPVPRQARSAADPLTVEAVTVAAYTGPTGGEFYCVIPWSPLGRLPHEFLSILPARLPGPVALRRDTEESCEGGCWIGITGDDRDVIALAASVSKEQLAPDLVWEWRSENRLYQMIQVWGLQAIPLGPEKFAHLIQTASRPEPDRPAGLQWYLERQSAFYRFARRLNLPSTPGSPVLFASCGARLLALASDRLRESPVA